MREITLATSVDAPIKAELNIWRAEVLQITLTPPSVAMALTISATPGGAPLVEIPSEAGGSAFVITQNEISPLTEGVKYWFNIWDSTDQDDPILLVAGVLDLRPTIQPAYVDYPTLVFEGATIVVVTQVQYDALVSPEDDDVIYVIKAA